MTCLKSISFLTMTHNRLARKKHQLTANFVVAALGNLPKMGHDAASCSSLCVQSIVCACFLMALMCVVGKKAHGFEAKNFGARG